MGKHSSPEHPARFGVERALHQTHHRNTHHRCLPLLCVWGAAGTDTSLEKLWHFRSANYKLRSSEKRQTIRGWWAPWTAGFSVSLSPFPMYADIFSLSLPWNTCVCFLETCPRLAIIYYSLSQSSAYHGCLQMHWMQGTGTEQETSKRDPGVRRTPTVLKFKGRKSTLSSGLIYKLLKEATVVL